MSTVNTVTEQLWAELSAAAGQPVAEIAHGYTLLGGVPLVTLSNAQCVGGMTQATLAQGRFGLDEASKKPQTWKVPMVVGTLGGGETRTIVTAVSARSGCASAIERSAGGSNAPTRSGHSIRHTESGLKHSASPAVSPSPPPPPSHAGAPRVGARETKSDQTATRREAQQ